MTKKKYACVNGCDLSNDRLNIKLDKEGCREMKKPIVALMYDFDKTLCTKDMQEYGFIPGVGMDAASFWKEVIAS